MRNIMIIEAGRRVLALGFCVTMMAGGASAQNVINSNTTIHNSLCVGFDCANTESYGFDTIRVKENNTRINFTDTSVGAFPTRDWEIRANDSTSGGASYLGVVDRGNDGTGSTVIGRFEAGAPANAFVVESDGDAGFGTLNPVLDLHVVDGDSPGLRLEQNSSSGFSPQTWDIAGNETSFFVRDATNGSTLPFRIFPSSASNTLVVRNSNVGVGILNPVATLHVNATSATFRLQGAGGKFDLNADNGSNLFRILDNGGSSRFAINPGGTVALPDLVSCSAGVQTNASGVLSCLASSRHLKNIAGVLEPEVALANIMALKPHVGTYKETPDVPEHWLIAQDAAEVEPAFVGLKDGEPYTVKTYGVVADLVAVIQLQQKSLEAQQRRIEGLERALGQE